MGMRPLRKGVNESFSAYPQLPMQSFSTKMSKSLVIIEGVRKCDSL